MSLHDDRVLLGSATTDELYHAAPRPLLVVPVGSCEQHGPHLPLDTDTRIAVALCESMVTSFEAGSVLVAPPLAVSASGEHASFPGTLSLGSEVFEHVILELVRSADWSAGVVLVNGHGGNADAVRHAVATLTVEGRRVLSWWPHIAGGDAHAGETETSLMLAIAPHLVRTERAEVGNTQPLSELAGALRAGGVRAVSENGVLGDPTGASARRGRQLLTRLTIDLVAAVDEWWV
jgi:mycofactocin precursor peptide peptidase